MDKIQKNFEQELEQSLENLKKSEERYRLIVEGASDGLWDWDLVSDTVYISREWSDMLGFEHQEIGGYYQQWTSRIHPQDHQRVVSNLNHCFEEQIPFYLCEYRIRLRNGRYLWISSRGKLLFNEEKKPVRIAGSHTDISQRKRDEESLRRRACYDPLTGMPIRSVFMEKLYEAIAEAKKRKLAVMFLDIDNFKTVNDTYGHHMGDKLLKRVAVMVRTCLGNQAVLSRMGGDEFAVLMPDVTDEQLFEEAANRIIKLFRQPVSLYGHRLYVTLSIGIAIYPDHDHGANGRNLVKKADIAMYKAKEQGKNAYEIFNHSMMQEVNLACDMNKDLMTALEMGELFLCYQPIVDAATRRIISLEALIRWKHPKKGIIPPTEFIPIAEEKKLIISIGEWVLRKACVKLKEWHEAGLTDCCIAVNVSAVQLMQPDFAETVITILIETGLCPQYLDIEITESALMESVQTVAANLHRLRNYGICISIDDFGTGYNSLKYIQKLPFNKLKIDRSFISNIHDEVNQVIINSIITIGHKFNAVITAEGIETKEQYEYLKSRGCDKIQGYYFSKPLSENDAAEFLKKNNNRNHP